MEHFDRIVQEMIARRRDFHRYPETGWTEFRTTAKIAEALIGMGYDVRFGGDFIDPADVMGRKIDVAREKARAVAQGADPALVEAMGEFTGLYADLDTGRPGPFSALRFDIDCVDTHEATDENHVPAHLGFASCNPGQMHACGHDGHAAIGVAAAECLKNDKALAGRIRLIFQPAEEGVRGGYAMSRAGIADGADYFFAVHLGLGEPTGVVYGGMDKFLCSTKLDADFTGVGAHAGGEPHKGRNALLAAATAALNLHAIAPHAEGATRINVGVLHAGDGRNVIAPRAHMKIETRGETDALAAYVYARAIQVLQGAAAMYDIDVTTEKQGEANTADSSPQLAALVTEETGRIDGLRAPTRVKAMTGSDDACWFMKAVQDGGGQATYIGIGATTAAGHHNDRFDFDEAAMQVALTLLHRVLQRLHAERN